MESENKKDQVFALKKAKALDALYIMSVEHKINYYENISSINDEYDFVKSILLTLRDVYINKMISIIKNMQEDNQQNNDKVDSLLLVLEKGVETDEDFVQLIARIIEYKYIYCYENIINNLKDVCS